MERLKCTFEKNRDEMSPEEREAIDRLHERVHAWKIIIVTAKFSRIAGKNVGAR